jgi:FtsH-binding integral membrane protein
LSTWHYEILGWALFVISAVAFLASSIRSGDGLAIAGSFFFLVACIAFLVPLLRQKPD